LSVVAQERCLICECQLHRQGGYGVPTAKGRSHASAHHFVPERFFGRSKTRRGEQRDRLLALSPWGHEGETGVFCYECHEELLHNPVLLPEDLAVLRELVRLRGLTEDLKPESREKLASRVMLFHEAVALGIRELLSREQRPKPPNTYEAPGHQGVNGP
jgi:hypothetical protein